MEPALAIVALAAGAAVVALVSDLTVAITRAAASRLTRPDPRLPAPVRRVLAVVVVGVSCLSIVRPAIATGATAPPSVRVTGLSTHVPSVDGDALPAALPTQRTYVVERGDCLWRIASALLSRDGRPVRGRDVSRLWRAIYEANRDTIGDDPNLIHPGQVLLVPQGQV